MKFYRRFFCVLILIMFTAFPFGFSAFADASEYSRVLSEDVVLYMDSDLTRPWFTLPYSYYVKVLSVGVRSVKVEYKGDSAAHPSVKGYIPIENLSYAAEPAAPYPVVTFEIGASCLLYRDTNFTYFETVAENSAVDFYGVYTGKNGKEYIFGFVSAASGDNYMGFIEKSAIKNFVVPRLIVEEEKPEEVSETVESKESSPKTVNGDGLQIVIVVGISVVAISIVYLLFRPSPKRAGEEAISDDVKY